jgi:beta-carotene/zeaxanthin 4-ketolase
VRIAKAAIRLAGQLENNYLNFMNERAQLRQTMIGIAATAAMIGTWLIVHIWAMISFEISAATWMLVPAIFALQCWLSVGMFIVAHDAMHGSLAPGRPKLNSAIGAFVLFLYAGFAWRILRDAHFDHHRHAGTAHDPDFHADDPHNFWPWYAQFLRRYFGWQSGAYVWTVVLTYYFILDVPPENILFLYGMPAILSSLQLFYFGTYRPHRHLADPQSSFADRHNARTDNFGTLKSLFSCFHFGYHHEHHLSPNIPWWGLPARFAAGQKYREAA